MRAHFLNKYLHFLPWLSICFLSVFTLTGCGTSPKGAAWAVADFNKYDKNYLDIPLQSIQAGSSKKDIYDSLTSAGIKDIRIVQKLVVNGEDVEILYVEKWRSVAGPDYIESRFFIHLVNGISKGWSTSPP
jgi:hypothetical protein